MTFDQKLKQPNKQNLYKQMSQQRQAIANTVYVHTASVFDQPETELRPDILFKRRTCYCLTYWLVAIIKNFLLVFVVLALIILCV